MTIRFGVEIQGLDPAEWTLEDLRLAVRNAVADDLSWNRDDVTVTDGDVTEK